jgi:cysteine-rich repeat protein
LEFSPERAGLPLTISALGQQEGVTVFQATGEAKVGGEVELVASFCGDGVVQLGQEECDDKNRNNNDRCSEQCKIEFCGDGITNNQNEQCDDGENANNDGCSSECQLEACGDGVVNLFEACDDGNNIDDDGCDADCTGPEVVQVVTGSGFTCALLDLGTVRCWGNNNVGQLGYGNTERIGDDELPSQAGDVPIGGKVVQLAAGENHACALLDIGKLRCWGKNTFGQLGYGNTLNVGDNETPASKGDVPIVGTVKQIALGGEHTCVLLVEGTVRCWGKNNLGQLGYGNTTTIGDNEAPPTTDVNVGGVVQQLALGEAHTCVLLTNGNVRCWGDSKRLGYGNASTIGNIGDNETPASAGDVDLGNQSVAQISASSRNTCVLFSGENDVTCWGDFRFLDISNFGTVGVLGFGFDVGVVGDDEDPLGDMPLGVDVAQVAAGGGISCVLSIANTVRCWGGAEIIGAKEFGIGYGNTLAIGDDETPASVGDIEVGAPVVQVSVGGTHVCVVTDVGKVRCWGVGGVGQLGYGSTNQIGDDEVPATAGDVDVTGL